MKKITGSVLTALLLSAMISGCGQSSGKNSSNSDPNKTVTPDYVVNIDDSFESGVELETARETLSPEEADFRNLKWGMTKEDVIYVEGAGARETSDNVLYYTRVREEDYPADAEYTFNDGKLVQGIFYITQNKENKSITLDDYDDLIASLTERFGEPDTIDKRFATDDLKTDDRDEMMKLVKENRFNYKTGWTVDNTEISVILFNKDNAVCIGLRYRDASSTTD